MKTMKKLITLSEAAQLLKISEEKLSERVTSDNPPCYISPPNANNEREVYFVAEEITKRPVGEREQ